MRGLTRANVRRISAALIAVGLAAGLVSGCSDHKVRSITITFVRHAQSEANAAGIISTELPGASLSEQGRGQAEQLAQQLGNNHYDAVYASPAVRTQQTAKPLADKLGLPVTVLPGLREIGAGWYEDEPVAEADSTYLVAPSAWLKGDRTEAIPGSINGNEFNDDFGAAVQTIYDSNKRNPVVFSHSRAIMYWTLMNVQNPKDSLATDHPLPNAGRIVITGNPGTGWRLVDWDGIRSFN